MAEQNDDSDKTLEATQHKLDEARKKGEFAQHCWNLRWVIAGPQSCKWHAC